MNEKERQHINDTILILMDYDGYRDVDGLKGLIDETRARLVALLQGHVEKEE